jgi:transposase
MQLYTKIDACFWVSQGVPDLAFCVLLGMFIRKKKNKSGKISVQIVEKKGRSNKVLKTIGCSNDLNEIQRFCIDAENWMKNKKGLIALDFNNYSLFTNQVLNGIKQVNNIGVDLLLGKIFDEIGFNKVTDDLFRFLVLSRLVSPSSKLKTTDYLFKYHGLVYNVEQVYRYLDKLHSKQKDLVQNISYEHTLKILDDVINIVFYDVTTMYFEIEQEDDLRKTGFSKDGKYQNPQIVLGLLVSKNGYPLAYDIFDGKKFEGETMMPIISGLKEKYQIENFMVVADAGLMNANNIAELENAKHQYIIGARIKNSKSDIKQKILDLNIKDGESVAMELDNMPYKYIISYSSKRAKKDAANRKRGVEKLEKSIHTGKLTKAQINRKGYNKFLEIKDEIKIELNQDKILEDAKWDGLKGYTTNSSLPNVELIENYNHLWQIEKAFRVAKSDLKVRPIFHRVQRRIEAHICIVFTAYKIYKELERQLKKSTSSLSPEKAIDIAKTIMQIKIQHPITDDVYERTLLLTEEQKTLASIFNF